MQVKQAVEINSSSKEIFDYLLDVENRKNYIPALEEVIMLDPLPIKKGSRYIEVAEIAGRKLETTYQVIALEKNKRLSAKTLKSIFPIQANLSLTEKEKHTVLSIELDFQLKGIFQLASGIIKGIVNQQAKEILTKIKQNLEPNSWI